MTKPITRGELAALIRQTHGRRAAAVFRLATVLTIPNNQGEGKAPWKPSEYAILLKELPS